MNFWSDHPIKSEEQKQKNQSQTPPGTVPLHFTTSPSLTFSIKAPLGCWTMQMFSRAEYWQDMRYSRFLFATGGWLVLGSSWQVRTPEKHYYSNSVIYPCSLNTVFSKCYPNICINLWKEIKSDTFIYEKQSILRAEKCCLDGLYLGGNSVTATDNTVKQKYVNKDTVIW